MRPKTRLAAKSKTPLTVAGATFEVTHEVVPIEELRLNPDNPRIRLLIERELGPKKINASELMEFIRDQPGYDALQKAIRKAGGISEPVIVSHNGLVIEGNTRITVFNTLHSGNEADARWAYVPIARLPKNIPEYTTDILMASVHVAGKTAWRPYAQAGQIFKLRNTHQLTFEQIADLMRKTPGKVKQYLEAYAFLVEQVLPNVTAVKERGILESKWSHALEYVTRKSLTDFRKDPKVTRVVAKNIAENKITGMEVRELDNVLSNPKAYNTFRKSGFKASKEVLRETDPLAGSSILKEMQAFTRSLGKMGRDDIALFKESPKAREVLVELFESVRNVSAITRVRSRA